MTLYTDLWRQIAKKNPFNQIYNISFLNIYVLTLLLIIYNMTNIIVNKKDFIIFLGDFGYFFYHNNNYHVQKHWSQLKKLISIHSQMEQFSGKKSVCKCLSNKSELRNSTFRMFHTSLPSVTPFFLPDIKWDLPWCQLKVSRNI